MTLSYYLQIIGSGNMIPQLNTEETLKKKIDDLDPEVAAVIMSTKSRTNVVLPRFNEFIEILHKLGSSFFFN
jgi:hypothetical protein